MRVLEIKNNLVKIAYDPQDNLALSGFVIIEDTNMPYVAQVMNLKADTASNFAIVKLLFTFNEDGILKNYNGTIPSLKSTVSTLPSSELLDIIPVESPLILGQLAQQNIQLKIDKTILENNLVVCSNNLENSRTLIENITGQLSEKSVIIDLEGEFSSDDKIIFGKDFKLPLNFDTIEFIYDNDLDDVDAVNKAVIQDIFLEVQEYTKTLPEKFLPFETFLNVVDAQYRETQIPQLILLKNKLLKYKELNVFAQELKDILDLSIAVESSQNTVIDISNIPDALQKEVIFYLYNVLNSIKDTIYAFVKINNSSANKKVLKQLTERSNVFTTIICPHEYKYISELKEIAQNLILFAPLTLQHDFASYNTFLNKLNHDEFIVYGAHTQNIPLIAELSNAENIEQPAQAVEEESFESFDNIEETNEIQGIQDLQDVQEVQDFSQASYPEIEYPAIEDSTFEEEPVEEPINEEIITEEPLDYDFSEEVAPVDNILEDNIEEPAIEEEVIDAPIIEPSEDVSVIDEFGPAYEDFSEPVIEDAIETAELEELPEDNEIQPFDEPSNDIEISYLEEDNDAMVEQAVQDVDRIMYEKLPQDDELEMNEPEENFELTEDDLNLIDDLSEQEFQSEEFEESNEPVVPIYPAEDTGNNDVQMFEPGERVSTPKYGEGVVEKMIKYGNKMLCYVEFPNIGKRLLDPSMAEITRL